MSDDRKVVPLRPSATQPEFEPYGLADQPATLPTWAQTKTTPPSPLKRVGKRLVALLSFFLLLDSWGSRWTWVRRFGYALPALCGVVPWIGTYALAYVVYLHSSTLQHVSNSTFIALMVAVVIYGLILYIKVGSYVNKRWAEPLTHYAYRREREDKARPLPGGH